MQSHENAAPLEKKKVDAQSVSAHIDCHTTSKGADLTIHICKAIITKAKVIEI